MVAYTGYASFAFGWTGAAFALGRDGIYITNVGFVGNGVRH